MNKITKKTLFWSPRVLGMLFALFISIFALDVFSEHSGIWNILFALMMHLIPTFIIVIVLIISWRWEWIGALIFIILSLFYVVWAWGRFHLVAYVTISGPLFLIGILFLMNWFYKPELKIKE
jgi:hypothetical protein